MSDCAISMKRRGICVIIPTYNNAGTIADVVSRTLTYCQDVFVIVDGSTDNSVQKLEELGSAARIIRLSKNGGKGKALREGFRRALEEGFSYAVTLDADGQHYPEDLPLFLEANKVNPGALIIGARKDLEKAERSAGSKFANGFSNFWFCIQTLRRLKDTQSGYRLYPLKKLPCLSVLTSRYEAELELLVFSAWKGVKLVSIDVNVFYPSKEERVSHFQPARDFTRISVLNTILCLLAVIYGIPSTIIRFVCPYLKTCYTFFGYFSIMSLIVVPVMYVFIKCGKLTKAKKEYIHKGIYYITWFARKCLLCLPFYSDGKNKDTFSKPGIIICNHQSFLDLVQMITMTPKLVVLTADYVPNVPLFGFIISAADFVPTSNGYESIADRISGLVSEGYSIAIYPEGTRSIDCKIGRFHKGAFYLADKLGLDIIPLVVYGTGKVFPKHKILLHSWPIYYEIGERISPEQLKNRFGESYMEQASGMRRYYADKYAEVADYVEKTLL